MSEYPIYDPHHVVLTRVGIVSSILTIYSPLYCPEGQIAGLHSIAPVNYDAEDYAGEIRAGSMEVRFMSDVCVDQFNASLIAPLMDGLSDSEYVLIQAFKTDGDTVTPMALGRVAEWTVAHQSGLTVLRADCGLPVWQHLLSTALSTTDMQGRHISWIVTQAASVMGIAIARLDEPIDINSSKPFLSYAEHPERRYADPIYAATPGVSSYALCYGGGKLWTCVSLSILSYDLSTHEWEYHGEIQGLTVYSQTGWRVEYIEYETTQLRFMVQRVPTSYSTGSDPITVHSEVCEVTQTL